MTSNRLSTKIYLLLLLLCAVASPLSISAQTRRSTVAANKPSSAPKCAGGWTGTVTYKRTQGRTDTKKVERVSGRGYDTRNWEMKYDYNAKVVVSEAPERNGSSVGKAQIDHKFSSKETVDAVELNSCDRGKTWKEMKGTSKSLTATSGSQQTDANVNIGLNSDGTYTVSVGLPEIQGQTTGEQSSEFSGQCAKKEGKIFTMPATPTRIDGNSLTSSGVHKIDLSDPYRIAGSFTQTWQDVEETIEWNLQRCGAPLRLTDLKFEDMKFPEWNAWREITEQTGTVDGNLVRIKAKVLNVSGETKYADIKFKEAYKGDKWEGARPDAALNDTVVSVRVEPNEEKEVEMVWDSSGYAWYDDGRPRLVQRIKAELDENGKKTGELTKNLKVAPKPILLVHGLWSNSKAWESWQNILTTSHSYDWKAFPVGEKPEHGVMNTGGSFLSTDPTNSIEQNAEQLKRYIDYAQRDRNAWHVDIVAHSMGGLISRDYIHRLMPSNPEDGRPQVSHLVMLGTPNMGSPCADIMNTTFETLGKNVEAVRQLRQDVAADFNKVTTNRRGVKFSVLAGDPLPTICYAWEKNDGVVTVPSAFWQIGDRATSGNVHTELTGTSDFSSFVKPRLAIGPKGNHNPDVPVQSGLAHIYGTSADRFYGAAASDLSGDPVSLQTDKPWAKEVTVIAGQPSEFELPIKDARNFGITFMAGADVTVSLIDDKAKVVGQNKAGTPESRVWFRSIFVDRSITTGTWKIRVETASKQPLAAVFTSRFDILK